jgi:hypothetical protein
MQIGHLQALRETPGQREVWAQGCHEDNVFEAKTVDQPSDRHVTMCAY